jgi:hypothetical protein
MLRKTLYMYYNMIEIFAESANEYDDWFNRHELAYRSELAAVRALRPPAGRGQEEYLDGA